MFVWVALNVYICMFMQVLKRKLIHIYIYIYIDQNNGKLLDKSNHFLA